MLATVPPIGIDTGLKLMYTQVNKDDPEKVADGVMLVMSSNGPPEILPAKNVCKFPEVVTFCAVFVPSSAKLVNRVVPGLLELTVALAPNPTNIKGSSPGRRVKKELNV